MSDTPLGELKQAACDCHRVCLGTYWVDAAPSFENLYFRQMPCEPNETARRQVENMALAAMRDEFGPRIQGVVFLAAEPWSIGPASVDAWRIVEPAPAPAPQDDVTEAQFGELRASTPPAAISQGEAPTPLASSEPGA